MSWSARARQYSSMVAAVRSIETAGGSAAANVDGAAMGRS
jgi:hypothetical protein